MAEQENKILSKRIFGPEHDNSVLKSRLNANSNNSSKSPLGDGYQKNSICQRFQDVIRKIKPGALIEAKSDLWPMDIFLAGIS